MSNSGFHLFTLLGVIDIFGAVYYLCLTFGSITKRVKKSSTPINTVLQIWQLLVCPIALFLSGVILYFNGWRLDPLMELQQLLIHLIAGVALAKQTRKLARDRI